MNITLLDAHRLSVDDTTWDPFAVFSSPGERVNTGKGAQALLTV